MIKHTSPRKILSFNIFPTFSLAVPLFLYFFSLVFTSQAKEIKEQEKIIPRTNFDFKTKTDSSRNFWFYFKAYKKWQIG